MITEAQMPLAKMEKHTASGYTCAECGSLLTVAWGGAFGVNGYVLRCGRSATHEGILRPFQPSVYDIPGWNLRHLPKKTEKLIRRFGVENGKALSKYQQAGALTKEQATEILLTVWPKAPPAEVYKAALICRDYGLNPLMKHVFLIPFNEGSNKESWAVVMGIKASRLIAGRDRCYGYLDDTPRVMTEAEQVKTFGEVDQKSLWVVTILKDDRGNTFRGYGSWPKDKQPYGQDKGNTKFNMAAIRSERNALEKMAPGALPQVEVMSEEYVEVDGRQVSMTTGEIAEAETVTPTQPETPPAPDLPSLDFKNAGEFKAACLKHFNLQASQVDKEIPEYDLSKPEQRKKAWQQIVGIYAKKED